MATNDGAKRSPFTTKPIRTRPRVEPEREASPFPRRFSDTTPQARDARDAHLELERRTRPLRSTDVAKAQ